MDLVGVLLIGVVLTCGTFYALWTAWGAWLEIRTHARPPGSARLAGSVLTWFQHGATILVSLVFLGVAVSICLSMARSRQGAKTLEALKAFSGQRTGDETSWAGAGHRGTFHVSSRPDGQRVTGASLSYQKFGNSDLEQVIHRYPHIHWFILSGTQIDDRGAALLAQRKNLRALVLADTAITDRGLAGFEGHEGLEELDLTGTAITDDGLKILGGLPVLTHLNLGDTNVTDAGLRELEGKTTLQTLNVAGTRITDAAVTTLATLKGLITLHIHRCELSPDAINRLRIALPECGIYPGQPEFPADPATAASLAATGVP